MKHAKTKRTVGVRNQTGQIEMAASATANWIQRRINAPYRWQRRSLDVVLTPGLEGAARESGKYLWISTWSRKSPRAADSSSDSPLAGVPITRCRELFSRDALSARQLLTGLAGRVCLRHFVVATPGREARRGSAQNAHVLPSRGLVPLSGVDSKVKSPVTPTHYQNSELCAKPSCLEIR